MLKLAILLTLLLILTVYGIYHSFLNRDIDIALLFSENSIVTLREYVNFKHAIKLVNVNIILNFLIPLLSFSAFFIGIKDNPNLKKMIIFTPFVFLGFFTAMVSFEKRPLIDVVLMLTICLGYTAHLNGFLKRWKMFFLLSIVFVSFAIFGILLLAPNLVISKSLLALLDRIFFGQIQSTYLYVEIFPQKHAYLGGASMIPFIYFSENPVSLARLVHEYLGMKKTVATGGSSPTIFWGEIYANFGVTPIFFVAVVLGIFLETISLIIKVIAPQAIFVIAYTWLGLYYSKIASTSFTTFIIDLKLIYTIFTLLFLRHCTAPNLKDLYSSIKLR